jgi:prepilin-type N-terminal cleavage/methylation domain-containing protein
MKKNRNGFTLAELLIVAAIIGVLVAISIPIFTSQLEKAREATDAANIRSQYAEVMTEAITEGSNVSGKDLFGAVKLKQKKDQWQSSGLKENLEGVYQDVEGDYPKAGGTAWVEYKDDQAILHYEGGSSGSGSGNTGGGSTGGGSTGGSDSGGNTGGGPGGSSALGSLKEQIEKSKDGDLPESIAEGSTYSIKNGNIYGYKGKVYVALTDKEFNHWYNPNPDNSNLYVLLEINVNTQILDSSSDRNNGIKTGSLYKKDDGSVWIRAYGSDSGWTGPPDGANWQVINGIDLK